MDLTCPSFVADETSDYGSRDNSDRESAIGGVCQVKFMRGEQTIFIWKLLTIVVKE